MWDFKTDYNKLKIRRVMYKVSRMVLSIFVVSLIALGCEGPSGIEGPQGPEGPIGPAGEDGSMMYSGEGEPSDDIGEIDDYYLDQDTGELYGPKGEDGWGNSISLQGAPGEDGADGQDGSEIHSGFGSPADSIGIIGDFYLDRRDAKLYGPKTEDGWVSFIFLRGPQGEPGEDGNANVRSSGWTQLPAGDWSISGGYRSPDDISINQISAASGGWFGLSDAELDGAVLVYVRGALGEPETGGRPTEVIQLPAKVEVSGGGKTGGIELRYKHGGDPDFAKWVMPIVGIQSGSWDTDYMINTYLPSLEFKAVVIGATSVSKRASFPPIDFSNYKAVAEYYGLGS